ncbi:hypothetical protein BRADI_1g12670v3 [Brachypodium distachyon]|uniref:CSC1/OSCA1-like 7TM region domain-containing protein n=1 Tax=Brachypodium distachyon TaxID=15368 RepID=A0A0Q3NAP6_BRADI|nr:hypothetical protein BRADI_1g12670v3 [Brachypodium distachyon]
MKVGALLTSAGINIGLCVLFLSFYSILRKQPQNVKVYFGRRIAEEHKRLRGAFILERFVPSPSWIVRSLQITEEEMLATAGLDAVVFNRILVFSIRIFSLAAILCIFGILPLNYFGQDMHHVRIPSASLETFTIGNMQEKSRWLWVHCVVLYIISCVACFLLYLMGAKKAYRKFKLFKGIAVDQTCRSVTYRCCLCGVSSNSFQQLSSEEQKREKPFVDDSNLNLHDEECAAAFVFFKTRYAALIVSEILQTSNPMKWVTSLAPQRDDMYWSNLWLPYKQIWIRHIATLLGSIVFMFIFLLPVTFIQGLTQLEQLQQRLPFLKGILEGKYMTQLVTGYLPSVILQIFLYTVPPTMMLFSTLEGPISHSERKKSACCKVLYFTIWNVFFVNVLSGSVISQLNALSSPKDIPMQLARAVPLQATFFTTYVLTSGWASLSSEVMQLFGLIWNFLRKYILRRKEDSDYIPSFPYHTELPKVLLFGLLGFTCSVLAPLILPFLLLYFFLAYVVYRNQYCRKRLLPLFRTFPAQVLIDMDRDDEQSGRMDAIHQRLQSAYCQSLDADDISLEGVETISTDEDGSGSSGESNCKESANQPDNDLTHPTLQGLPVNQLRRAVRSLGFMIRLQKRGLSA